MENIVGYQIDFALRVKWTWQYHFVWSLLFPLTPIHLNSVGGSVYLFWGFPGIHWDLWNRWPNQVNKSRLSPALGVSSDMTSEINGRTGQKKIIMTVWEWIRLSNILMLSIIYFFSIMEILLMNQHVAWNWPQIDQWFYFQSSWVLSQQNTMILHSICRTKARLGTQQRQLTSHVHGQATRRLFSAFWRKFTLPQPDYTKVGFSRPKLGFAIQNWEKLGKPIFRAAKSFWNATIKLNLNRIC